MKACFVTGTDTDVGKTLVSASLLYWLSRQGLRVAGYKPVASGMEQGVDGIWRNADVECLRAAGAADIGSAQIGPLQFRTACAPHIAAALEGAVIQRADLVRGARDLARQVDRLVVEGAGGLRVPLGPDWDSADLMADLDLPVILVVGMRLGCINHALLTAEGLRARGLKLAAWVANTVTPQPMPWLEQNLHTLEQIMDREWQLPCLGRIPHLDPAQPQQAAAHLDAQLLGMLFDVSPASGVQAC